jgi:hypothetical protein
MTIAHLAQRPGELIKGAFSVHSTHFQVGDFRQDIIAIKDLFTKYFYFKYIFIVQ